MPTLGRTTLGDVVGQPLSLWSEDFSPLAEMGASDVYETDREVVVQVNVDGVPSDKINLSFDQGVLSIKADQIVKKDDVKRNFHAQTSWSYSYQVAVPGKLDAAAEPQVKIKDGMIVVKFKKAA